MFSSYTMLRDNQFPQGLCANRSREDYPGLRVSAFSCEVVSSSVIAKGIHATTNRGLVHYIFQTPDNSEVTVLAKGVPGASLDSGLWIDEHQAPISTMGESQLAQALQATGMRGRAGDRFQQVDFDFRALLFVCGYFSVRVAAGSVVTPKSAPADFTLTAVSTDSLLDIGGMVVLTPALCNNREEVVTMCCLLSYCGLRGAAVPVAVIPRGGGKLAHLSFGAFCARTAATVIAQASELGSGATHLCAYLRGLSHGVTIRAHSHEGGFVRNILDHAVYPKPRGLVNVATFDLMGIAANTRTERITLKRLASHAANLLLVLAAASASADPGDLIDGIRVPAYCIRNVSRPARPSDWDGLDDLVRRWSVGLTQRINVLFKFPVLEQADPSSYVRILVENRVNRHLQLRPEQPGSFDPLVPFFWVEPSCIDPGLEYSYFMPSKSCYDPRDGGPKTLKTFPYSNIRVPSRYTEDGRGHAFANTQLFMTIEKGQSFRSMGGMYTFSHQMSSRNGLASVEILKEFAESSFEPFGMTNPKQTQLGRARWDTPHNCIPHPMSGLVLGDFTALRFKYSRASKGVLPSASALKMSNETTISCGPLVEAHSISRVSRNIPTDRWLPRRVHKHLMGYVDDQESGLEISNILCDLGARTPDVSKDVCISEPLSTIDVGDIAMEDAPTCDTGEVMRLRVDPGTELIRVGQASRNYANSAAAPPTNVRLGDITAQLTETTPVKPGYVVEDLTTISSAVENPVGTTPDRESSEGSETKAGSGGGLGDGSALAICPPPSDSSSNAAAEFAAPIGWERSQGGRIKGNGRIKYTGTRVPVTIRREDGSQGMLTTNHVFWSDLKKAGGITLKNGNIQQSTRDFVITVDSSDPLATTKLLQLRYASRIATETPGTGISLVQAITNSGFPVKTQKQTDGFAEVRGSGFKVRVLAIKGESSK